MKKLVLLFAVALSLLATSCMCHYGPESRENEEREKVNDSTSVVVEDNQSSVSTAKEEVKDEAQAAPNEEKETEETQENNK